MEMSLQLYINGSLSELYVEVLTSQEVSTVEEIKKSIKLE
jgi:hypothetical protein